MIGPMNSCPFHVGGGTTATKRAYDFVKAAVGTGGSADEDTIEDLWRRCKAIGLASANSHDLRVVYQFWPHLATDLIPWYERTLGIQPGPGQTENERRDAVIVEWIRKNDARPDAIAGSLKALDSRFSVLYVNHDQEVATVPGRVFAPHDPSLEGPSFGYRGYSQLANYSSSYIIRVHFDVGYSGRLQAEDALTYERARSIVLRTLPSVESLALFTEPAFTLGQSLLGLGALA